MLVLSVVLVSVITPLVFKLLLPKLIVPPLSTIDPEPNNNELPIFTLPPTFKFLVIPTPPEIINAPVEVLVLSVVLVKVVAPLVVNVLLPKLRAPLLSDTEPDNKVNVLPVPNVPVDEYIFENLLEEPPNTTTPFVVVPVQSVGRITFVPKFNPLPAVGAVILYNEPTL